MSVVNAAWNVAFVTAAYRAKKTTSHGLQFPLPHDWNRWPGHLGVGTSAVTQCTDMAHPEQNRYCPIGNVKGRQHWES